MIYHLLEKNKTDNDLYKIFNLTKEEIKIIEDLI